MAVSRAPATVAGSSVAAAICDIFMGGVGLLRPPSALRGRPRLTILGVTWYGLGGERSAGTTNHGGPEHPCMGLVTVARAGNSGRDLRICACCMARARPG